MQSLQIVLKSFPLPNPYRLIDRRPYVLALEKNPDDLGKNFFRCKVKSYRVFDESGFPE
nr:hypothetical protein CPGR_00427 [Mycolicibacterium komanii]